MTGGQVREPEDLYEAIAAALDQAEAEARWAATEAEKARVKADTEATKNAEALRRLEVLQTQAAYLLGDNWRARLGRASGWKSAQDIANTATFQVDTTTSRAGHDTNAAEGGGNTGDRTHSVLRPPVPQDERTLQALRARIQEIRRDFDYIKGYDSRSERILQKRRQRELDYLEWVVNNTSNHETIGQK